MGGAPACLALLEEPALPMLKEAAGMGNPAAAATIQLIQDARGAVPQTGKGLKINLQPT